LEAQAQQLTESNEQMAPQAKEAGKSERSWVSSGGFAAGRLDAMLLDASENPFFKLKKVETSSFLTWAASLFRSLSATRRLK
jgi:hypothetical protein